MKLTICFFVIACALIFVAAAKNDTLVNFKVSSALLKEAIESILIVYIVDAPVTLELLPLNATKLRHLNYIKYELPPTVKTARPTWAITDGLPGTFNSSSELVVEIWQRLSDQAGLYVGGTQFTVGTLLKYPAHFNRSIENLHNSRNNRIVGTFFFEWHASK